MPDAPACVLCLAPLISSLGVGQLPVDAELDAGRLCTCCNALPVTERLRLRDVAQARVLGKELRRRMVAPYR